MRRVLLLCAVCVLFSGCATWYQRSMAFQQAVGDGEFEQAEKLLKKDKRQSRKKNQILYYLNLGYVHFMLGNRAESNAAFETAERLTEEQQKNALTEAAVLVSNPEARAYKPEDFEVIMINVYKALNYLLMVHQAVPIPIFSKISLTNEQIGTFSTHKYGKASQ